jgi:hypothetical protein
MPNNTNPRRAGVQRLDYKEAEKMLRAGATQQEVADRFGVRQAAVSLAISRGNIKHDTGFERRLPWHMHREHVNLSIPRSLRLAMRVQAGEEDMPEYLRRQGEGFIRTLDEMDAVIHYEPEVSPYFFRVPRRHGIDLGLIREPEVATESEAS